MSTKELIDKILSSDIYKERLKSYFDDRKIYRIISKTREYINDVIDALVEQGLHIERYMSLGYEGGSFTITMEGIKEILLDEFDFETADKIARLASGSLAHDLNQKDFKELCNLMLDIAGDKRDKICNSLYGDKLKRLYKYIEDFIKQHGEMSRISTIHVITSLILSGTLYGIRKVLQGE